MRLKRPGYLLAEALCALALAGVLAATAAVALGGARRSLASIEGTARVQRAAREAVGITAALLRDADSVVVQGDTAVRAALLIALGVACHIEPSRRAILLPPVAVTSGVALTSRAQPLEAGDLASLLAIDSLARHGHWVQVVIDSVHERTASSPCGPAEGWTMAADAGMRRMRLVLRDSLPSGLRAGAPVRVMRRGRLALYHAGSGDWMLGWRRCAADGLTCGAAQPVAGPLLTPAARGLRFRAEGPHVLSVHARAEVGAAADSGLVVLRGLAP